MIRKLYKMMSNAKLCKYYRNNINEDKKQQQQQETLEN